MQLHETKINQDHPHAVDDKASVVGGEMILDVGGFTPMHPLLTTVVENIEDMYGSDSIIKSTSVSTGFTDLDTLTYGLQPGDLVIVAGRPSMGKTSFSINVAENVALAEKKSVAIFSMEMNGVQLASRMLGSVGRLNQHDLHLGKMDNSDWSRLTHALGKLNDAPLYVRSPSNTTWTASAFIDDISNLVSQESIDLGLVVIDGVQYLDVLPFSSAYDRNIQLGEQVRQIKKMAMQLGLPVILTSPLNRDLESRPNKRPVLKDLRDIGMLEDIADLILFIYRDELYNLDSDDRGQAEIIVAKQRKGPVAMVKLAFRAELTRFDNLYRMEN
jgi:replicative DNA helicase